MESSESLKEAKIDLSESQVLEAKQKLVTYCKEVVLEAFCQYLVAPEAAFVAMAETDKGTIQQVQTP